MTATYDSSPVSLAAAADLSTKVHRFGKFTSTGVNVCTVVGERADGIIGPHYKKTPAAGDAVDFFIERIPLVEAGAAYSAGDPLTTDALGRAITATAGTFVNAYAIDAATAAGQIKRVLVPHAAAPVAQNVANENTAPGSLIVHQYEIADAATDDYDITITDKIEVLDVLVQKTGGAGGAANTVQVKNAANAISDVIDINIADTTLARALTINDANSVVAAAGTLRVSVVKAGGNAACKVTVIGIKRA